MDTLKIALIVFGILWAAGVMAIIVLVILSAPPKVNNEDMLTRPRKGRNLKP